MARFALGQVVATPPAMEALRRNQDAAWRLLARHERGDWGEGLGPEDKAANDAGLSAENPDRLLSSYLLADDTKIWIITERDRSVTTVLLPEDY